MRNFRATNSSPLKVNIGSGNQAVPGFLNIDRSPNVILSRLPWVKRILRSLRVIEEVHMASWDPQIRWGDARKLKFSKDSVSLFYSSHFFEHVYLWEAQSIFSRCYSQLAPKGILRLALPDSTAIARKLIAGDGTPSAEAGYQFNESLLSYPLRQEDRPMFLLDSFLGHVHKWHPTEALVKQMLHEAGFSRVVSFKFQVGEFPDLSEIETRAEGTFYLEAHKA